MTTKTDEPAFVASHRARKAEQIVRLLRDGLGLSADEATRLTPYQRREVEIQAGVRKASDATWRVVVEMLAGSTMPTALCRTCGIGDPEGVDGPPKPFGHDGPCAR